MPCGVVRCAPWSPAKVRMQIAKLPFKHRVLEKLSTAIELTTKAPPNPPIFHSLSGCQRCQGLAIYALVLNEVAVPAGIGAQSSDRAIPLDPASSSVPPYPV